MDERVKTEDMRQWWDQYFIIYSRSLVPYTWKDFPANMYMYDEISVEKHRTTHWQDWIHVTKSSRGIGGEKHEDPITLQEGCSFFYWKILTHALQNKANLENTIGIQIGWGKSMQAQMHTYTCNLHNGEHHEFFIKYLIKLLPFLLCLVSFSFSDCCRP